jgi:hypothetical protein
MGIGSGKLSFHSWEDKKCYISLHLKIKIIECLKKWKRTLTSSNISMFISNLKDEVLSLNLRMQFRINKVLQKFEALLTQGSRPL